MRPPTGRSLVPVPLPSLAEVQQDVTLLRRLSVPALVELRRQVGHLSADLDAAYCTALTQANAQGHPSAAEPDQLLTPDAAAARFGVTKRWLLAHADEIPGVTRLSRKVVRFSARRLARFLDRPAS